MKSGTTGVIMASGEGSRMRSITRERGVPKHLLPIGKQTIASRLTMELGQCCDQVICIAPLHYKKRFEQEFQQKGIPVSVVPKPTQGFKGDFLAAYQAAAHERIVLTVGDLIFPQGEIVKFVNRSEKIPEKLILALDRNRLKVPHLPTIIDVRMILASIPKPMLREMIDVNPEAIGAVIKNVFFLMLKNKIKIVLANTRFNVNTPIEYHRAHKYFSSRDETG